MGFKHWRNLLVGTIVSVLFVCLSVAAEPYRIVGFGDSLMAGFGLEAGEAFPEKLEAALRKRGHDVVIANAGVSGDTTSGGLSRLDWSVPDDTDLVILELGANDMLRGIDPGITERNLDAIIARLLDRGIKVVLAGMLAAPSLGPDFQSAFDAIYPRLAERHDVPLYPFFLDGVVADPSLLLDDGMHPSSEGIDRMVERFVPFVEQLLPVDAGP